MQWRYKVVADADLESDALLIAPQLRNAVKMVWFPRRGFSEKGFENVNTTCFIYCLPRPYEQFYNILSIFTTVEKITIQSRKLSEFPTTGL